VCSFRTAGPRTHRQLAMDVPAIPSARCDEREARLHWTGARPIRDGHLRPVIRTDDSRWRFRGSPEICESLIPILQRLTWFLSRFHVRRQGEKTAVFFACIEDFSTQANYFQKCACMSTLFFPDNQYAGLSPSKKYTKLIKQVHPTFVWVTAAGYRLRPPQWK
jgi:hypothetical protein